NFASVVASTSTTQYQQLNFQYKYKPGFKVLLGTKFGYDNWDLYAEYTWYHTNTMTTRYTAPGLLVGGTSFSGPVLVSRALPFGVGLANRVFNEITKTWKLKLDFIDLILARSYYVGKKLILRPGFGARAAYIRQHLTLNEISHDAITVVSVFSLGGGRFFGDSILSWGYGLKGLLDVQYQITKGFRILSNAGFDLLYTRYNLKQNFDALNLPGFLVTSIYKSKDRHDNFLRPHAELEFGFGYGDCFSNGRWYVDLEAAYGFQVFWDQNMTLTANFPQFNSLPSANLFLHGARFTARFDF
ncbi:MAG TPA: Lpg1974 family pore-forming outer membrane protein, partial [Chlamydiales bacterium]|nr:Lpg1974 family pore-forming outer membrane protein [Chlamydiales bacterium]